MTDPAGVIDRSSSVPFHYQLRKLLEQQIETGRWAQGDRLPSEPFLSEYYSVSRATVRQALHALEQEGLIHKEKGRGAFVNKTSSGSWLLQWAGGLFDDELTRRGITVESTVIRAAVEPLPDWASEALHLSRGADGVALGAPPPGRRPSGPLCGEPSPAGVRGHLAGDPEDLDGLVVLDAARAVRRGGRRQQSQPGGGVRPADARPPSRSSEPVPTRVHPVRDARRDRQAD